MSGAGPVVVVGGINADLKARTTAVNAQAADSAAQLAASLAQAEAEALVANSRASEAGQRLACLSSDLAQAQAKASAAEMRENYFIKNLVSHFRA